MANELRKRENAMSGVVDNNPLTNSGTTLVSTELAALPAVSASEQMVIILDPDAVGNGPEYAYVTSHVAASTGATIVRGREGTSGVQHANTIVWVCAPTKDDFNPTLCTSATRPSTGGLPYEGQSIYETDTKKTLQYTSVATGWVPPWNLPWGLLGYSAVNTSQTGINALTDLTNLTSTVTVAANRRIKVTGFGNFNVNGALIMDFFIKEGSTELQRSQWTMDAAQYISPIVQVILAPSGGSHTYKLAVSVTANSLSMEAAGSPVSYILVEDIGPTGNFA